LKGVASLALWLDAEYEGIIPFEVGLEKFSFGISF